MTFDPSHTEHIKHNHQNHISDHNVLHIKQNYSMSAKLYKSPHDNIFICIEMARLQNWITGKNTRYFERMMVHMKEL